ncbi:hypothetical protein BDC45DRAFT_502062 [Circinella umbellata]|nr:hypothetical protein BDC45DRAFT_502062 [Circinella umbellata]
MQQLSNALEDNAWRDLSHSSRLAFHNAKYDQAIDASTLALENLTRALVAILDIRAASHGKKAEFTQGLRDAFKMIEHVPTLSAGYLRAGNLYAIRGKQVDAERIYEQGLRAVSPVLDQAGYSLLSEHKEAAKAQQEQRINFVHFPIEICAHIFSYLSMDTLFGCMSVSRLWRDTILQCASAWYQIELSASSKYAASMYYHFGSLSRHVRSMSLDLSWSCPPNRIPSQLVNGGFTNLRTLKLQGYKVSSEELSMTLQQIGSTLTSLLLEYALYTPVSLGSILSMCPKLTELKYCGSRFPNVHDGSSFPLASGLLSLYLNAHDITDSDLEAVLRCCPKLRNLAVYGCEPEGMRIIDRYCNDLQQLRFNSLHGRSSRSIASNNNNSMLTTYSSSLSTTTTISSSATQKNKNVYKNLNITAKGLRVVDIGDVEGSTAQYLADMLRKGDKHTLEELYMAMHEQPGPSRQWRDLLCNFDTQRLVKFGCKVKHSMHTIVAGLIRQSRTLQDISFWDSELISIDIFDAMITLPRLHRLHLATIDEISDAGIRHFFNSHIAFGFSSPLRVFELEYILDLTNPALSMLADILTLQYLRLCDCDEITTSGMTRFSEKLSLSSSLINLELCKMDCVNDKVIRALSGINTLQHMKMMCLDNVTDQGVWDILDRSTSIRSIDISCCFAVSAFVVDRVKQKLQVRKELRNCECSTTADSSRI